MTDSPDPEVTIRTGFIPQPYPAELAALTDEESDQEELIFHAPSPSQRNPQAFHNSSNHASQYYHQKGDSPRVPMLSGPAIRPESYDGNDTWEEYISHFEDCAELCRWDDRSKVLYLAASLRGQARTFYMSLSQQEKRTYRALINKLNQRFGSSRHQSRWLAKLEVRKRQPGETIAAVGDDIRQMSQKAYCNLDGQAQETLAMNHLYKIISTEMKCRCIDRDCETISDAVDVIERYEAILGESYERKRPIIRAPQLQQLKDK